MSLYIHALIKLLGQTHRFLCGKIQGFGCLLLHGTCRKWNRRLLGALSQLHLAYLIRLVLQPAQYLIQFLFVMNRLFSVCIAVVFGRELLLRAGDLKFCLQIPVFLRDKGVNLILPVTDHSESYGLDASRTQPSLNLSPENGADHIAHHTVQNPSRLLGVHQIHINLSRFL